MGSCELNAGQLMKLPAPTIMVGGNDLAHLDELRGAQLRAVRAPQTTTAAQLLKRLPWLARCHLAGELSKAADGLRDVAKVTGSPTAGPTALGL